MMHAYMYMHNYNDACIHMHNYTNVAEAGSHIGHNVLSSYGPYENK